MTGWSKAVALDGLLVMRRRWDRSALDHDLRVVTRLGEQSVGLLPGQRIDLVVVEHDEAGGAQLLEHVLDLRVVLAVHLLIAQCPEGGELGLVSHSVTHVWTCFLYVSSRVRRS